MQKNTATIGIVAGLMVTTGLYQMFRYGLQAYLNLFYIFSRSVSTIDPVFVLMASVLMLTPILKFSSAIGLLLCKRRGWIMAVAVLALDFLFGLQAAIRISVFLIRSQHLSPHVTTEGHHVLGISVWPTYIMAILGAVLVLVLIQEPILKRFGKQAKGEQRSDGDD